MAKAPSVPWTREHCLIALNLYCKLPFGKLHKGNTIIVETAERMGRTPSSLAMKLVNFASLDPVQQARGIHGLSGATKKDKGIWDEFHSHLSELGNGLCLSTLHDAAFDAGLITLDERLTVVLSKRLRSFFPQPALERNFVPFEGQPICLPEKLAEPDEDFLRFHRHEVFQG